MLTAKSRLRSIQQELELQISCLESIRAELSSQLPVTESRLEDAQNEADQLIKAINAGILTATSCEQSLLALTSDAEGYAHLRRFQDITAGLKARYTRVQLSIRQALETRRTSFLLEVRDRPSHKAAHGDDEARQLLQQERVGINSSIAMIQESLTMARASYASLSGQGSRVARLGKQAGAILATTLGSNALMTRIRRLQIKQHLTLLAVFCTLSLGTLIYIRG